MVVSGQGINVVVGPPVNVVVEPPVNIDVVSVSMALLGCTKNIILKANVNMTIVAKTTVDFSSNFLI